MSERPVTQAAFDSQCAWCFEPIYEGDEIGLIEPDGEWAHLRCAEEEDWPDD